MARPLRIEFPGAVYHITARGNARQAIYLDDEDADNFLRVLGKVVSRFDLLLHAYCLMDNHYHLLVETPNANLSRALRQLNGVYTQSFNRRHGKSGSVLQGRFKSILVDKARYLLQLARYVVLTPVRAKLVKKPDAYRWSSFRATVGLDPVPAFLSTDWVLSQFAKQRAAGQRRYWRFVLEGVGGASPWAQLQGQILLGDAKFVASFRPLLQDKSAHKKIPKRQRLANRPPLKRILTSLALKDRSTRNVAIRVAHVQHGYRLTDIGDALGLHYSTISRIVTAQDNA
ncbi:MAG: transposase [Betaproteobacteria bacterium]